MKRLPLLSLLILSSVLRLAAQPYFPFKLNEKRYYFGYAPDAAHYTLVSTDSSVNQQPKTYRFAPTINPVYADILADHDCVANGLNSILGSQVKNYGDTSFEFINFLGKPSTIYLNTPIGYSWHMYADSNALAVITHDSTTYRPVNGEMDSVKCFSIVITDLYGDLIIPLDYQLRIGQKAGFIQFPNLYTFPIFSLLYTGIAPHEFYLAKPEIHNITWDSVYDFSKSDEMHTHYVYYSKDVYRNLPPVADTLKTTIEILSDKVVFNTDSIGYLTKRTQHSSSFRDQVFTSSFKSDTVWMNFKRNIYLDIEPTLYNKSEYVSYSIMNDLHGLYKFNHIRTELSGNDSCFSYVFDASHEQLYYYNGLGGPYYQVDYYNDALNEGQKFNKLVYYKKGNKTWGVPISKTVGMDLIHEPEIAQVYPNPTQGIVTILLHKTTQAQFVLVDVLGRIQFTQDISAQQTELNLNQLPKGIYIYTISNKQGKSTGKLIID